MKTVGFMTVGCLASWVVAGLLLAPQASGEILLGMLMPLLVAAVSLVGANRTYRRDPRLLTPFMVKAFVGKMIVFGAYVVVVVAVIGMAPRPFIISFTLYFIALHLFEALHLRRMFESSSVS